MNKDKSYTFRKKNSKYAGSNVKLSLCHCCNKGSNIPRNRWVKTIPTWFFTVSEEDTDLDLVAWLSLRSKLWIVRAAASHTAALYQCLKMLWNEQEKSEIQVGRWTFEALGGQNNTKVTASSHKVEECIMFCSVQSSILHYNCFHLRWCQDCNAWGNKVMHLSTSL